MKRSVPSFVFACTLMVFIFSAPVCAQTTTTGEIPELVFMNPVLTSGNPLQEGAIYRFKNVATGMDATIKLKKFSRKEIVMESIDLFKDPASSTTYGWEKAFQPQFGLLGNVAPNQDWFIDFEMTFLKAGTDTKQMIDKFTLTALDVDGDGLSIKEYVLMEKATSVSYSNVSYFNNSTSTLVMPTCPVCGKQSNSVTCTACSGTGKVGKNRCIACNGVGKVYAACLHPWDGQNITVQGPKDNFSNIDTSATAVMATYIYNNKDVVNFRIGAKSGDYASTAGIRLNSLWFKGFNLAAPPSFSLLPLTFETFSVVKQDKNVVLRWVAQNDDSYSYYVVERSTDGKSFSEVATVLAADHAEHTSEYSFKEAMPAPGTTVLYRVRSVDQHKQISFSPVAAVRTEQAPAATLALAAFPNPAQNQVTLKLPATFQGAALTLNVYTVSGRCILTKQYPNAGATETVQLGQLPNGTYLVAARSTKGMAQQLIYKN